MHLPTLSTLNTLLPSLLLLITFAPHSYSLTFPPQPHRNITLQNTHSRDFEVLRHAICFPYPTPSTLSTNRYVFLVDFNFPRKFLSPTLSAITAPYGTDHTSLIITSINIVPFRSLPPGTLTADDVFNFGVNVSTANYYNLSNTRELELTWVPGGSNACGRWLRRHGGDYGECDSVEGRPVQIEDGVWFDERGRFEEGHLWGHGREVVPWFVGWTNVTDEEIDEMVVEYGVEERRFGMESNCFSFVEYLLGRMGLRFGVEERREGAGLVEGVVEEIERDTMIQGYRIQRNETHSFSN
ncbi:hypothetical protein BJ508DRAFT_360221 [Ascobolus immersus RN42]|uniref:Uncharacterized protein n=1 Tax=Ascobolus immersus RN42 TaxID=1160509 RepID=A0A3N4II92_ASCIM|nr:hypothetical protein BJ508DRAFT_360221 [Ascobolus immersus RN42]